MTGDANEEILLPSGLSAVLESNSTKVKYLEYSRNINLPDENGVFRNLYSISIYFYEKDDLNKAKAKLEAAGIPLKIKKKFTEKLLYQHESSAPQITYTIYLPLNSNENLIHLQERIFLFINVISETTKLEKYFYIELIKFFNLQQQVLIATTIGFGMTLFGNVGRPIGLEISKKLSFEMANTLSTLNKNGDDAVRNSGYCLRKN